MAEISRSKLNDDLASLLPKAGLSGEAAALVAGLAGTGAAVEALAAAPAGLLVDATRLIAHALPRREAVWWACMCARSSLPPESLLDADRAAIEAAEAWVRSPTDELRRAAFAHAEAGGFSSPEACAAVGAFWSGDSMAPVGQPAVPPPAHVAGAAVAGSVALASVRQQPERRHDRLRSYLQSAYDISRGGPGRLPLEAP